MSDPFKVKNLKAALEEVAEIPEQVLVEQPAQLNLIFDPSKKHSKEEAKAHIAKQFALGIPVFVICLQKGEHPKTVWQEEGKKFKLEQPEAYSHRWMKLA